MLKYGADINLQDRFGCNAYNFAEENGNIKICEMLETKDEYEESANVHVKTEEELKEEEAKVKVLARRIKGVR